VGQEFAVFRRLLWFQNFIFLASEFPKTSVWIAGGDSGRGVQSLTVFWTPNTLSNYVLWGQLYFIYMVFHLLACFDGEFYLVHWWKMFILSALSNMGHEIRHHTIQKLNHLTSGLCWCTVLLEGVRVKLSPQVTKCVKMIVLSIFCDCSGKTSTVCHQWTRWSSPSKQGSYSATVSTSCDKPRFVLTTHGTLWRQHYIMASKEYLISSHILSKYFELVFFATTGKNFMLIGHHLSKLWKKEKGCLFIKHCLHAICITILIRLWQSTNLTFQLIFHNSNAAKNRHF